MLKFGTGTSNAANPKEAGMAAAKQAKAGVEHVKLAFVYGSVAYDIEAMLAGVKEELPGVPLIGNTSFTGVVTPAGFCGGDSGFVGIMVVGGEDITAGVSGLPKGCCARDTGMQAAEAAMKAAGKTAMPDYCYIVAPPGEEEAFIKGVSDVVGRVPMFGGSAADNSIAGEWLLYTCDGVFADGVGVAFLYLNGNTITNLFTGAYHETGDVGIITKVADKRVLVEIDGQPALKKYASWRGMKAEDLKGMDLLVATITSPLGVKDRLGELTAIRHPMNGNDDYSMNIGANLAEKTAVIRMEATVDELINSVPQTLAALKAKMPGKPLAYHLVHCGGRRAGIAERIDEMVAALQKEAGNVPFIMEFTFGEYGFEDDGNNTVGGLMLSFTGFSA